MQTAYLGGAEQIQVGIPVLTFLGDVKDCTLKAKRHVMAQCPSCARVSRRLCPFSHKRTASSA